MAETPLPVGAFYTGATHASLAAQRKADEAAEHGYLPTVFDPKTCRRRGYLTVAEDRVPAGRNKVPTEDAVRKGAKPSHGSGAPAKGFRMFYELHGDGPEHIVFIMGLNNSCFGWLGEVEHLANQAKYSCLVMDNRGASNSDAPSGLYSTSEMARDVLELLDSVGWKDRRSVHVVGVSMGGMISLELAKLATERIASLSLISTTSGQGRGSKSFLTSLPPWTGVSTMGRVLSGRVLGFDSDDFRINSMLEVLFPPSWLAEPDPRPEAKGRTRRETVREMIEYRFHLTRRATVHGSLSQVAAVFGHYVSPAELARIGAEVPSVLVLTGDNDNLVHPDNSRHLAKHMPSAEYVVIEGGGHALPVQLPERVCQLLTQTFERGRERSKDKAAAAL